MPEKCSKTGFNMAKLSGMWLPWFPVGKKSRAEDGARSGRRETQIFTPGGRGPGRSPRVHPPAHSRRMLAPKQRSKTSAQTKSLTVVFRIIFHAIAVICGAVSLHLLRSFYHIQGR